MKKYYEIKAKSHREKKSEIFIHIFLLSLSLFFLSLCCCVSVVFLNEKKKFTARKIVNCEKKKHNRKYLKYLHCFNFFATELFTYVYFFLILFIIKQIMLKYTIIIITTTLKMKMLFNFFFLPFAQ